MKRFFLLTLLAIFMSGIASAQNANRNGFFLELGLGGLVGDTPRSSFSITENVLSYKCLAGAAGDFGLGGRFRMGNHWAYEFKIEAQIPFANPINALVGRVLPIGFRYTSLELWRNYSLYAHFNLGGAITVISGVVGRHNLVFNADNEDDLMKENFVNDAQIIFSNMPETYIKGYRGNEGYGISYSGGIGFNITTHLYLEGCMSAQALFSCYGKNGKGVINYGMVSCIIGYRF